MGMFDKDKEIGLLLTSFFQQGEQFILWGATIDDTPMQTKYGLSDVARLKVSKKDDPRQEFEVTTVASAIVAKVTDAEPDDFPALVMWRQAPSERSASGLATVLQFIAAWGGSRASTPRAPMIPDAADPAELAARSGGRDFSTPEPREVTDDDIPF